MRAWNSLEWVEFGDLHGYNAQRGTSVIVKVVQFSIFAYMPVAITTAHQILILQNHVLVAEPTSLFQRRAYPASPLTTVSSEVILFLARCSIRTRADTSTLRRPCPSCLCSWRGSRYAASMLIAPLCRRESELAPPRRGASSRSDVRELIGSVTEDILMNPCVRWRSALSCKNSLCSQFPDPPA